MPLYINVVSNSVSFNTQSEHLKHNLVNQNSSPLLLYRTARNVKLSDFFRLARYIITVTWKKHLLKHSYSSYNLTRSQICKSFFSFCLLEILCFKSSSSDRRVMVFICWWVKGLWGLCFRAKVTEESNIQNNNQMKTRGCMHLLNVCPQEPVFT